MAIDTEARVLIKKPPSEVFAFIDELSNTPKWNVRCVEVKQTSPGPRAAGTKLHYRYRDPGREGTMDGEVVRYAPGRELLMRYTDAMIDVDVGFTLRDADGGTELHHTAHIVPKSLVAKLMSPLIRKMTAKQTDDIVAKLKALLEP